MPKRNAGLDVVMKGDMEWIKIFIKHGEIILRQLFNMTLKDCMRLDVAIKRESALMLIVLKRTIISVRRKLRDIPDSGLYGAPLFCSDNISSDLFFEQVDIFKTLLLAD